MFNLSGCDPAVHKRCSFLQLTTTYCGMWAGLRSDVSFIRLHSCIDVVTPAHPQSAWVSTVGYARSA